MKKPIYRCDAGRVIILRSLLIFAALLLFTTCKPKIYEFRVEPLTIWPADSVQVTWKARGEAVLMVNDRKAGKDTTYRVFTLGFPGQEGGQHIMVTILNEGGLDKVVFKDHFQGDSLEASGIKNLARWGDHFAVGTVSNPGSYPLDIYHEGRKLHLDTGKTDSSALSGTAVRGFWELRTRLTPVQRADSVHLPASLSIMITVKHH
jgi:hypothetical protein